MSLEIKVIMQYCHLPKARDSNDVSNPISLGMEPVKELETVLYTVSKIGEKVLFFNWYENFISKDISNHAL